MSLAGLDCNPEIKFLSANVVIILCGPSGKPKLLELTPNGVVISWSQPEYGCHSLANYTLCYQKKCEHETSEWQKLELESLKTHTCVPDLNDGDTYVFKICTVSDADTLQYSDESDSIIWSGIIFFTKDALKVISTHSEILTLMFSSNVSKEIMNRLLINGVISKEDETQICLALTSSKKATILVDAIRIKMQLVLEKFVNFLQILIGDSLMNNAVEIVVLSEFSKSVYYRYMEYLKWLYGNLEGEQSSSDQWPPSATKKFFRLAMIQLAEVQKGKIDDGFVRVTMTGKVDDIL